MIIAACKYPLETLGSFSEFAYKQELLLTQAKKQGATIAVLPEYLALELAGFTAERSDLAASLLAIQEFWPSWQALFARLAQQLNMWICAGTFLVADGHGRYFNRAGLFSPTGTVGWQDKILLTGFEKNSQLIAPGNSLQIWQTGSIYTGVAVCYDSEFPLSVRAQREAGAQLILVPSCTDTPAGASRVRIGCQARALENRLVIACATTAGALAWSPALDINTGEAAIVVPMDIGLPDDGIVAQTSGNNNWAVAEVDFNAVQFPAAAQVANDADWPYQITQASIQKLY